MRAPDFWTHGGALARGLQPLAWLYGAAGRLRWAAAKPWRADVPVLCVGNLVAGGAGKTPTALALGRALAQRGIALHFLSRGHGGRLPGPVRVDPNRHRAADVGDEPLLLAAAAPAWIARDRAAGARAAIAGGAQAIIMDDGFQNPGLAKDLSFVVIDEAYGLGNGRVHPAGPLREPAGIGLARADRVVLLQSGEAPAPIPAPLSAVLSAPPPPLTARLIPSHDALALRGRRVLAFAGIGRPQRFFHTVRELGAELVGQHGFPDHHPYREDEIWKLVELARELDAQAVTTAKDAVRLPPGARDMVTVIDVALAFDRPDDLDRLLDHVLGPAPR
jgi:tetraacyldisaccharide 4'-kinase